MCKAMVVRMNYEVTAQVIILKHYVELKKSNCKCLLVRGDSSYCHEIYDYTS